MRFLDSNLEYTEPEMGGVEHNIQYYLGNLTYNHYNYSVFPNKAMSGSTVKVTVSKKGPTVMVESPFIGWRPVSQGEIPSVKSSEGLNDVSWLPDGGRKEYTFTMPNEDVGVYASSAVDASIVPMETAVSSPVTI